MANSLSITFHGHACFMLEADGRRVVIDPFLTGNPAADITVDRLPKVDAVDRATIVATFELAAFCATQGATAHAMHLEMQLLAGRADVMLVPIGDNYTMGIEDAARAVELVRPRVAIPMHYNTWDLIAADPEAFKRRVGSTAEVVVLSPGQSYRSS